jgi:hypothetical protein
MVRARSSHRPAGRAGKIVVLVALALVPVVAFVAMGTDGGLLLDNRRHLQAAADSAALSAAGSLFENCVAYQGLDTPSGAAAAAARAASAGAGYTDGVNATVTVNIPPLTGDHVGVAGYAEVVIEYDQPRYFSGIFGSDTIPVKARAVARGRWSTFRDGILVLNLTQKLALKINGNGIVGSTGADVIVNSNDPSAIGSDGTNATISVSNGDLVTRGGVAPNTTLIGALVQTNTITPDPLAYLPQPTLPNAAQQANKVNPNSAGASTYLQAMAMTVPNGGKMYVLSPGRYDSLPNFTSSDIVILQQASAGNGGIYYLNGCGLTSTGATIVMDPTGQTTGGVMLYNAPGGNNSAGININGGTVRLSPPTSGPYTGIEIFQDRTSPVTLQIAGQGGMQIYGTFYAASALMKITGSSTTNIDIIGSQYISDTLQAGGNGNYTVSWNANQTARLRQINLTE